MAAPAWIQRASSVNAAASNSFTPTFPGSIVAGNYLVMSVSAYAAGTGAVSTPSGWAVVANQVYGFSSEIRAIVFGKVAAGGDTAPTLTGTFSQIFVEVSEVGLVAATPLNASASGVETSGVTIPTPASSAAAADSLAVWLAYENRTPLSYTASPSGSTNRYAEASGANSMAQVWADKTVASGAVAADSFTRNVVSQTAVAHTLVVAPAAAAATFVPRIIASY